MISQYENNLVASVYLWAEHTLLQKGQAYVNLTTRLFPTIDPKLPTSYQGYSSPLKGWVYDSGVSGAHILNSVSGGGYSQPLTRDSGVFFDYINGRVIVPKALGTSLVLSGTAAYPEFRFYQPNEDEEFLLTQGKYFINPKYRSPLTASGAPPRAMATPAIFVNPIYTHNEAYEFGGIVDTKSTVTLTVIAESSYQLNAVLSLFRDARYDYIPMLDYTKDPLNGWGDFKGGTGYNYVAYSQTYGTPGNLIYIEDVRTAKISDRLKINDQQFGGIVDLDVCFVRQPSA